MNHRVVLVSLLVLLCIFIFIGFLLIYPELFNLCKPNNQGYCYTPYSRSIGMPLFYGLIPILFLSFFRKEVFFTWIRFAIPAFIVSFFLIFITSPDGGGGVFSNAGPNIDRVLVTLLLGILFLFISLIIIIVKATRLRRKDKLLETRGAKLIAKESK